MFNTMLYMYIEVVRHTLERPAALSSLWSVHLSAWTPLRNHIHCLLCSFLYQSTNVWVLLCASCHARCSEYSWDRHRTIPGDKIWMVGLGSRNTIAKHLPWASPCRGCGILQLKQTRPLLWGAHEIEETHQKIRLLNVCFLLYYY